MDLINATRSLIVPTWEKDITWKSNYPDEYEGIIKTEDLPDAMKNLFAKRLSEFKKDTLELRVVNSVWKIFNMIIGTNAIALNGATIYAKGNNERLAIYELAKVIEKHLTS